MASLGKMLKDMGWEVRGSDQNFYPPASTYLKKNGIPVNEGYDAEHIGKDIDLVVIGGNAMHVVKVNPEVERAKELGLKIQSYPEVFVDFLEKPESILVMGTYGKTTICAMLAWIMEVAGYNPSFDFAEVSLNFPDGTRNTDSRYSIIHGDEHPTLGYSELPKLAYFHPKYLLHTVALWDHFNVYPTEENFVKVFRERIKKMPKNGLVLMNLEGENNVELMREAVCPVHTYSVKDSGADYFSDKIEIGEQGMKFDFVERVSSERFLVELPMMGRHNVENAVGAIGMARLLSIKVEEIQKAMKSFKGLKRHLELVTENEKVKVYRDQGQHPGKFKGAVEALKERYPNRRLLVILDPHASVLHDKKSLRCYDHTLDKASEVIIGMMKIRKVPRGSSKHDRVTGRKIRNAIKRTQPNVRYLPVDQQILDYLQKNLEGGEVLLFLTTGSFRGLVEDVVLQIEAD